MTTDKLFEMFWNADFWVENTGGVPVTCDFHNNEGVLKTLFFEDTKELAFSENGKNVSWSVMKLPNGKLEFMNTSEEHFREFAKFNLNLGSWSEENHVVLDDENDF